MILHLHGRGQGWYGRTGELAMAALEAASREFQGDPKRTYLSGTSMGLRRMAAYIELAGVGHEAWRQAYADPDLPTWLLSHRLGR